jgi:hypothetical protein
MVLSGIVESNALLEVHSGCSQLAKPKQGISQRLVS